MEKLDKGDLIRLSDLMKFPIRIDHYDKVNGNEHFVYGVETVLEYAENLPRVEAEPVEILTLEETARYLRVSGQTVYNMIRDGRIKASKVGREWRFLRSDIESYLGGAELEPVVHAHWEGNNPGEWCCSHCKEYAPDGGFEQTKRCPHCGAHMDEEVADGE